MLETNWSHVVIVTVLGFAIVLLLLVLLIYILKLFGFIMTPRVQVEHTEANKGEEESVVSSKVTEHPEQVTLTANATAAIAMALHLYYHGVHDEGTSKVNIRRIERRDSPWNNKLYGMNNLHRG